MLSNNNFEWNDEEYRKHIESVCIAMKEYYGGIYKIVKNADHEWEVAKIPTTRYQELTYVYTELNDAIDFFIQKEPRQEL